MNDDRRALLETIIADPGDDLPRLVYCDWLEEREETVDCTQCGGEGLIPYADAVDDMDYMECDCCRDGRVSNGYAKRAEFIRVQVELEQTPHCEFVRHDRYHFSTEFYPQYRKAAELHKREIAILHGCHPASLWRNWSAWCYAEMRDDEGRPSVKSGGGSMICTPSGTVGLGGEPCECSVDTTEGRLQQVFRRGFVADIKCTMAVWEKHGPAICREHPVERVEITDKRPESTEGGWSYWCTRAVPTYSDFIPLHITDRKYPGWRSFFSVLEANDWLSRRCIAWARSVNS